MTKPKHNYYILSGAMGAGKSTLLQKLKAQGLHVVEEPARQILKEQRAIEGEGLPEKNSALFTQLLLSRQMTLFEQMSQHKGPVIFDRGVADNIAYAKLFGLCTTSYINTAKRYRYNRCVFIAPAWQSIYVNDDERKMSYQQAKQFGIDIETIYQQLGYDTIELPCTTPDSRVQFMLEHISHSHDG
jgi:predicted ATPase